MNHTMDLRKFLQGYPCTASGASSRMDGSPWVAFQRFFLIVVCLRFWSGRGRVLHVLMIGLHAISFKRPASPRKVTPIREIKEVLVGACHPEVFVDLSATKELVLLFERSALPGRFSS